MNNQIKTAIDALLNECPYPVLFATVTGSHAFGYATEQSDYDVHGVHLIDTESVLGLSSGNETIERKQKEQIPEVDASTHELKKFILLMLKGNGNVLEDLYSPLIVKTGVVHEALMALGKGCITKKVASHYRGMAYNQQRLLANNEVKKLLHMYRCLLMGIHLMRGGQMEMNLVELCCDYHILYCRELILHKQEIDGRTQTLPRDLASNCLADIEHLQEVLEEQQQKSKLPEEPTTRKELEQLLVRVRLGTYVQQHAIGEMCKFIANEEER